MTTHLGVMILFAACASTVFAALLQDEPAAQLRFGTRIFSGLVVGAWVVGWVMYLVTP